MSDTIRLLEGLVKIPSPSNKDNSKVIELILVLFNGYETELQDWVRNDGVKGKNLIVKIPGKTSGKSLVFVCHMDTVPPSSMWETDPFKIIEEDGKLYGLGSCDTKGGAASLIQAVLTLTDKPYRDLYLVFSGDEEVTSTGMYKLMKNTNFSNPRFVFIEPTDNRVLISQRAALQIDIVTHGTARHGSYAMPEHNEKDNAIFKMAKAMQILIEDASENSQQKDPLLGSNTQNFGIVEGGTARNVFADKCVLKLDRRLLPSKNMKEDFNKIKEKLTSQDSTIDVIENVAHSSFSTSEDSELVQKALKVMENNGRNEGVGGFQAWSEAGLFAEFGPVIILGPGSIKQAHLANEFVGKKEIEDYVNIFQQLIAGV